MRFSDLCEWYFENYAPNKLKAITAYNYRSQLYYHIIPQFGNYKLKEITTPKITALFKALELSASTSRKVYIIIQSVFKRAVEQGFIKESPCKNVILPKDKTPKQKKPFLDEKGAKDLLSMVKNYSQFNTHNQDAVIYRDAIRRVSWSEMGRTLISKLKLFMYDIHSQMLVVNIGLLSLKQKIVNDIYQ